MTSLTLSVCSFLHWRNVTSSGACGADAGYPGHQYCCDVQVAIKKVLQDKRFKNRELQIMKMMSHPNVVGLKHCFYSTTEKEEVSHGCSAMH